MNPFEHPPTTAPVSFDPPSGPPRRGRTALVVLATAGIIGAGVVGISQLVSADTPSLAAAATTVAEDEDAPPTTIADDEDTPTVEVEGQIVIDNGEGEPVVIELDEGSLEGLPECVDFEFFSDGPLFDFDFDPKDFPMGDWESGEFGQFGGLLGDGTHISVMGPDGMSIIEIGEGDGSVTITKDGDTVTITTDGDTTVTELGDLIGGFEVGEPGDLEDFTFEEFDFEEMLEGFDLESMFEDFDFEQMMEEFEEMMGEFESGGHESGGFGIPNHGDLQGCLDDLAGE